MNYPFITRHKPTEAQEKTLRLVVANDRARLIQYNIPFTNDPISDLRLQGIIKEAHPVIAAVAPSWIVCSLLNEGFTVIAFRNYAFHREKGTYVCSGADRLKLVRHGHSILMEFTACPISRAAQEACEETGEPVRCMICGKKTYTSEKRRVVSAEGVQYVCDYCSGDMKHEFEESV